MKEFKLEIDKNTKYIKALRYLGAFMAGISFYPMLPILFGTDLFDWDTLYFSVYGVLIGTIFFYLPENWFKGHLLINDEGIFTIPSKTDYWGSSNKIYWKKIKSISLSKNHIEFINSIGSTRKVRLPIYTDEQWTELKDYLRLAAEVKGVEFS